MQIIMYSLSTTDASFQRRRPIMSAFQNKPMGKDSSNNNNKNARRMFILVYTVIVQVMHMHDVTSSIIIQIFIYSKERKKQEEKRERGGERRNVKSSKIKVENSCQIIPVTMVTLSCPYSGKEIILESCQRSLENSFSYSCSRILV